MNYKDYATLATARGWNIVYKNFELKISFNHIKRSFCIKNNEYILYLNPYTNKNLIIYKSKLAISIYEDRLYCNKSNITIKDIFHSDFTSVKFSHFVNRLLKMRAFI